MDLYDAADGSLEELWIIMYLINEVGYWMVSQPEAQV